MHDRHRLAVCSWSLEPDGPAGLAEALHDLDLPRTQLALQPLLEDPRWRGGGTTLKAAGIELVSGMFGCVGEDYSTLQTIRDTGGIVPDAHWDANRDTATRVADLARSLGIPCVSFHAGFIPHEPHGATFNKIVGRIRTLADAYAQRGLGLLLETGQETAASLLGLLDAVARDNLGVNFDPANMILYGMGDPVESLAQLMPHVRQVHLKDALPADTPGVWGTEVPVGQGAVDWPAFLGVLQDAGYKGDLVIEREAGDNRAQDIATAAKHITSLT